MGMEAVTFPALAFQTGALWDPETETSPWLANGRSGQGRVGGTLVRVRGSWEWAWEIYDSPKASNEEKQLTVESWTIGVVVVTASLASATGTWDGRAMGFAVEE